MKMIDKARSRCRRNPARKDRGTGEDLVAFGYKLDERGRPIRGVIDTKAPGDYGADPLGNGKFRMVPSGDIVDYEERCKRLSKRNPERKIQSPSTDYCVLLDLGAKKSTVRVMKAPWRGYTAKDAWTGAQPKTILWVDFDDQAEAKAAYKAMTKAKIEKLLRK